MTKANGKLPVVSGQVRQIPVGQLVLSPEETRKTIDQAALAELAKSIAKDGVIESLIVRPAPGEGDEGCPCFEVVAGQRRWLASKLAGEKTCPCEVREMSDAEAAEVRIVSNLQRENLPAMEEAEAYGKLLEAPGATIETVAAALAKAPSYVGRRVQLLKAIEPVRQALKAGAIEVGHALELARLDEAQQRQMLTRMQVGATLIEPEDIDDDEGESGTCRFCGCTDDNACAGGCSWANDEQTVCTSPECLEQFREQTGQESGEWRKTEYSVVELRREIADAAHVDLKNAPFPLIADLDPMPCTDCPKRAGNAQLLFDDCAQDTCTDRPCFNRKVNLWIEAELAAAKAEKRKLLKLTDGWGGPKDAVRCAGDSGARVLKTVHECEHGEEGIWIDGRNAGKRAKVCRKEDCKTHYGSSRSSSSPNGSRSSAPDPRRKALLARVRAEKAYRAALFAAISVVPAVSITSQRMQQLAAKLALFAFNKSDSTRYGDLAAAIGVDKSLFGWRGTEKLEKHVAGLSIQQQLLFASMAIEDGELCVHEHDVPGGGTTKQRKLDLEGLAEIVGVDWRVLRKQGNTAPVKAPRAAAARPAKKGQRAEPAKPDRSSSDGVTARPVKHGAGKAKPVLNKPARKNVAKKKAGRK